jgi:uncharacterized protein YdeI (YjbR/CyaY-like superfamily)
VTPADILYFPTPAAFRTWLLKHHAVEKHLWVGFHRKGAGTPSLTWQESVDEALCFGWIDGIRKRIDEDRYTIRFTPRKTTSNWSAINIARVKELTKQGRMKPAGLAVYAKRDAKRSAIYAYENRPKALAPEYEKELRRNARAAAFFDALPPAFRKLMAYWVMSARKEETRRSRLAKLIAASAAGKRL